jgi:hypothetical protein
VLGWWAFTVSFLLLRLLTWAIRVHVAGLGNVSAGGVHVHNYLWGIVLIVGVAACGLGNRTPAWQSWMGVAFGIGLALIIDEIALPPLRAALQRLPCHRRGLSLRRRV